ncbi:MAG: SOS response-associated peptidase family protein [Phycisphaerae bacterium]|nr:SOS response-associated peptidase family protein [Phycisphaerae bacterium]
MFYDREHPAPPAPPAPPTTTSPDSPSRASRPRGTAKQPWYIHRADGTILLVAGLWERWSEGTGEGGLAGGRDGIGAADSGVLETFTIVTVPANGFMACLHDRMPAVLEPEAVPRWLDAGGSIENVRALLMPAADGVLTAHRVSTRVNSPRNNEPGLVQEEPGGLFG